MDDIEPNTDISRLIFKKLVPLATPYAADNPGLSKLIRGSNLPVEELKSLEETNFVSMMPPPSQKVGTFLLWARMITASVRIGEFCPLYSSIFLTYSQTLREKIPNIILAGEVSSYIAKMAGGILKTESIEELNQYYEGLKKIRELNLFGDIDVILETAREKYVYLLSSNVDCSREAVVKQLNSIVNMNRIGMHFELTKALRDHRN